MSIDPQLPQVARPAATRRRSALIVGLVALNVILGIGVALRLRTPAAFAQVPGMQNGGNYLVTTGRNSNAITIYALQLDTLKLMAFKQDPVANRSSLVGTADVGQDLDRGFPPTR